MQPSAPSTQPEEDPFKYGWRFVKRVQPNGEVDFEQIPLTLEDVLHPEEEDQIPMRPIHALDCTYLHSVFRTRPLGPAVGYVSFDLRIDFQAGGVRPVSPDVAVFVGLNREPDPDRGTLLLGHMRGRCLLALEVVSPDTRDNDVLRKVELYHRVGVPLYVLIDQEEEGGTRSLVAYRHTPAGYAPLPLDQGRLFLPFLDLFLTMHDNRPVCLDRSGRELGDYADLCRQLEESDRRAAEQEKELESAIDARQQAEKRVGEVQKALTDAENKAREAQAAFQLRIQELEAALRATQGGAPSP